MTITFARLARLPRLFNGTMWLGFYVRRDPRNKRWIVVNRETGQTFECGTMSALRDKIQAGWKGTV